MELRQYIEKLLLGSVHPENAAGHQSGGRSITTCCERLYSHINKEKLKLYRQP